MQIATLLGMLPTMLVCAGMSALAFITAGALLFRALPKAKFVTLQLACIIGAVLAVGGGIIAAELFLVAFNLSDCPDPHTCMN